MADDDNRVMVPRTLSNYDALTDGAITQCLRDYREAGWVPYDIAKALHKDFGLEVTDMTVRNWLRELED